MDPTLREDSWATFCMKLIAVIGKVIPIQAVEALRVARG
jgi:hypothetical protein